MPDAPLPDPWPAPRATGPVEATVGLPGSKSLTNRALVLAALADGPSVVRRALRSRDSLLMAAALTGLGSHVDTSADDWTVTPGAFADDTDVDCGLAGTVMRFVPPVAALSHGTVSFDGDPHMRTRPIGEVLLALRHLGVEVDDDGRGALPFRLRGHGSVRGGRVVLDASQSSQFVSALLLAGVRYDEGVDVRHDGKPIPSLPHIDMTVAMLREQGVEVDDSDAHRWAVAPGPLRALASRAKTSAEPSVRPSRHPNACCARASTWPLPAARRQSNSLRKTQARVAAVNSHGLAPSFSLINNTRPVLLVTLDPLGIVGTVIAPRAPGDQLADPARGARNSVPSKFSHARGGNGQF